MAKDETCPDCGTELEDPDLLGVPGGSAKNGDHWCHECEVGYETYELSDIVITPEAEDDDDGKVDDGADHGDTTNDNPFKKYWRKNRRRM